jgi:glucokinase
MPVTARVSNARKHIVGIDLGGTNMQVGVLSPAMKLVGRTKAKTRAKQGPKAVIDRIVEQINEACTLAKITPANLACVGIGAPGAIDPKTGTVLQAPNLRWTNVPLAKTLAKALACPVHVTNDVRAAAIGEHRLGAGRGCTDMLCLWIGTGIGGGLILNNELYTGHFNAAGEIGHMTLFPGSPPGSRTLEQNCSRTAIVDRIIRLVRAHHPSLITDLLEGEPLDHESVKARTVGVAYAKGDQLTRDVVDDAARFIGVCAASLASTLSFQRIVLGGGLTEAMGETLVRLVRTSYHDHVYPHVLRKCEIVKTKLEADAGVFGAALFAKDRLG